MKTLHSVLIGFVIVIGMSSNAIADYLVSGAGADEVNGVYAYFGLYQTDNSDGIYSTQDMPVYKNTNNDYYLAYRGCSSTKWVILELVNGPNPTNIGAGPGDGIPYGYIYINTNDLETPPPNGWESRHSSPEPLPTVAPIASYSISGAGSGEVNGHYAYLGLYQTDKSEGIYANQDMPVFKNTNNDYYLAYRGCVAKWVILELMSGPFPANIGGGPGDGYIYINTNDLETPPPNGWESRHSSLEPPPTVALTGSEPPENPNSGVDDTSGSGGGGAVAGCFITAAAYGSSVEP